MIKRTLYFGNPAYLSVKLAQLEIRLPQVENNETLSDHFKESVVKRVPIEDVNALSKMHLHNNSSSSNTKKDLPCRGKSQNQTPIFFFSKYLCKHL